MNNTLDYIRMFLQFPISLRRLLKHTLTLDDACRIVRERMEHREENFLRIVKRSVYGYPCSPYLALLKMVGCDFEDLSALVKQRGLEGALCKLREEGFYVTFEEFKGRKPIIRFGKTIPVEARDFDNPFAQRDYTSQTSGSTGLATYIALGCVNPTAADDMHLFKDAFALITYPYPVEGSDITVPAFNLSTLLDSTSKLMLNVQIDDYGIVEERTCGCELETYGYTTHLREIHSYSKLVGEGVTLIENEMLRILEEILPARFGGSSLDYQLVEQEDKQGFTRLCLLIHPHIKIVDEQAVIEAVLKGLRGSSPMADAARTVWQQAQTLRIMRQEPVVTAAGKLLPLHIQRYIKT